MAVRYTVTEDSGHQHTRKSRGHIEPEFTHAVVMVPGGTKAHIKYSRQLSTARGILTNVMALRYGDYPRNQELNRVGDLIYPDAKIYPVAAEVL